MFVQIVAFRLKPDVSRESFLALTRQMIAWLESKTGFIAYELYEGNELWSDRIAWKDQAAAKNGLDDFLTTTRKKALMDLLEADASSFFGQTVAAIQSKSGPTETISTL